MKGMAEKYFLIFGIFMLFLSAYGFYVYDKAYQKMNIDTENSELKYELTI